MVKKECAYSVFLRLKITAAKLSDCNFIPQTTKVLVDWLVFQSVFKKIYGENKFSIIFHIEWNSFSCCKLHRNKTYNNLYKWQIYPTSRLRIMHDYKKLCIESKCIHKKKEINKIATSVFYTAFIYNEGCLIQAPFPCTK